MAHLGIICPNATGHLNPMIALGRELQRRGHPITMFQVPDAQAKVEAAGLGFQTIGASEFPLGSMAQLFEQLGQLSGMAAVTYSIRLLQQITEMTLRELPDALKAAQVDALLVDQIVPGGGTVAELLDLPFVTVCCALATHADLSVPPFITNWPYSASKWGRFRNLLGYLGLTQITRPLTQTVNAYRQQWGLSPYLNGHDAYSRLAQLSQQPPEFEFPRTDLPSTFHFTGPYQDSAAREPIDFPFEQLTGQPLIYASLGTLQNSQQGIFRTIAQACADLPVQLVISLGKMDGSVDLDLPGSPLVVAYAPQLELLKRASLTITHAGLNTVLESLANGVPLVAIPITNDQPGVAARLRWTGAGEVVPLARLQVARLRSAIQKVLTQDSYRQNAARLQAAIQRAGGVRLAADIVEQAVAVGLTHSAES